MANSSWVTNVLKWDRTSLPTGHLRTQNGSNLWPKFMPHKDQRTFYQGPFYPTRSRVPLSSFSPRHKRYLQMYIIYLTHSMYPSVSQCLFIIILLTPPSVGNQRGFRRATSFIDTLCTAHLHLHVPAFRFASSDPTHKLNFTYIHRNTTTFNFLVVCIPSPVK